jgi:hypothetical protein
MTHTKEPPEFPGRFMLNEATQENARLNSAATSVN